MNPPPPVLSKDAAAPVAHVAAATAAQANPLLLPWIGPHGGLPPFDRVRLPDFKPALLAAMAEELAEIETIAAEPDAPTFGNTLAALERSGRALARVISLFGVYTTTLNDPAVQRLESDVAPILAAHADRIIQNDRLFGRITAVYEARERLGLDAEQWRLAWVVHTRFVHAGARLDRGSKAALSQLNQQLAALHTTVAQNLLADENDHHFALDGETDLEGLPEPERALFAAAARSRGIAAQGAVLNTRSSVEPFLEYSSRRDLRERVWRAFVSRGDQGNAHDNNETVGGILSLRAQRAVLLGYPTHAHWRLEDSMAKTPERALALMNAVWKPAVARVRQELAELQTVADCECDRWGVARLRIEAWDYRYYAAKLRRQQHDLDANEIKSYLQLEQLRAGLFWVGRRLFGLRFEPLAADDAPVPHPDVRVFEVSVTGGRRVGLWYFDPYARPHKVSGAWMSCYRRQECFDGPVTAIVSNNANFSRAAPGDPVLISWDDAVTLFHEFGHALHGLVSSVHYPSLSGTEVARDYVEFPSQLLERWLSTTDVLQRFALHYQTGAPMPLTLIAKIHRARTFNEGFRTVEYLASALLDMRLHLACPAPVDLRAFEREVLDQLGMPPGIAMRHRTAQFAHLFAGDGYSAGYYSYLWADTLSADAWEAFTEATGPYDPTVALRLRDEVLAAGNTRDPADAYRSFRGRDPGAAALMRDRGLPLPPASP